MRLAFSFLFLFCLYFSSLRAQHLVFEKPENLKTLPSKETYNIIQDGRGYIWFSSEAGLCRYNGEDIKIFSGKNGLPEEACYATTLDSKGDVWIATSRNRILKVVDDSLVEAPFSKRFEEINNRERGFVICMEFSALDTALFVTTTWRTQRIILKTNTIKGAEYDNGNIVDVSYEKGIPILHRSKGTIKNSVEFQKRGWWPFSLSVKEDTLKIKIPFIESRETSPKTQLRETKDKRALVFFEKFVLVCKENFSHVEYNFAPNFLTAFIDDENGLWTGHREGGLNYYPNCDLSKPPAAVGLEGLSVSGIVKDKEGNIWCTTLEDGVFMCGNQNLHEIITTSNPHKKDKIFFKCIGDSVFVVNDYDEISVFSNQGEKNIKFPGQKLFYITDILPFDNKLLICGKDSRGIFDNKGNQISGFTYENLPRGKYVINQLLRLHDKEQTILGCYFSELLRVKKKDAVVEAIPVKTDSEIRGLIEVIGHGVILYTRGQIYEFDPATNELKGIKELKNIIKIVPDKDGQMWVLTKGNLLYKLSDGSCTEQKIPFENVKINDIAIDKLGNIWLAANSGILKMSASSDGDKWFFMDQSFGLPLEEFNMIGTTSEDVVFSSDKAVYKLPLTVAASSSNYQVPFILTGVYIDGEKINRKNKIPTLNYRNNDISFHFDALEFRGGKQGARIKYSINDTSNASIIDGREIVLNSLASGDYTLHAWLINEAGNKISEVVSVNFIITPPFWQKWPFLILAIVIIIAMTILISAQVIKRIRRREAEKTRVNKMLADYRMSALRAQMNPHFIFNCINSIQRYVLTNKTQNAYDYLAKFSKLIREVLNLSEENMIPLRQELEIVELYIQMEQIRYEGYFDYEITIDEKIDTSEVFIPSLLLQPYIENGIWHGIMNLKKSRQGKIKLEVAPHGDDLQVVIEDNGVGREAAAKQKLAGHKSKALGINKQRMELVEEMNKGVKASITITDLYDEKKQPFGTRVVIIIPQALGDE